MACTLALGALLAFPLLAVPAQRSDALVKEEAGVPPDQMILLRAVRFELAREVVAALDATLHREHDPSWKRARASSLAETYSRSELERMAAGDDPTGSWIEKIAPGVTTNLVYTPVTPCRVFDTSSPSAIVGSLVPGVPMPLVVAGAAGIVDQGGQPGGCGIPFGPATAVMVNFVAKNPAGKGNVRAYAWDSPAPPPPTASIINYNQITTADGQGMNIANGVIVPICATGDCSADLYALATYSGTHLIGDVLGYFSYAMTAPIQVYASDIVAIPGACTNVQSLVITAPVAGHVLVQTNASFTISHTLGSRDVDVLYLSTSPTSCELVESVGDVDVASAQATGTYRPTGSGIRIFAVPAGSNTFYMNILMGGSGATVVSYRWLTAVFLP